MKRVLLLGIILAIFILLIPQGVSAAEIDQPDNVVVTANVEQTIACTASTPDPITLLPGTQNTNNDVIDFTVNSTNNWDLIAKDNATAGPTHGFMVPVADPIEGPFAPAVADALDSPLAIENATESSYSPLTSPVTIAADESGSNYAFKRGLQQPVSMTDYSLTRGWYQITLVFTCTNTDVPV